MPVVPPLEPPADAPARGAARTLTPRPGLVALLVAALTLACIALWVWQHLRTQTLLRDQLVAQAEKRSQQLADAMATLPPDQQEALVLCGAMGFSAEDAAVVAGVQLGTLKMRLSRARRALAARYEGTAG